MLNSIIKFISLKIISPIHWTIVKYMFTGRTYDLSAADREFARDLMSLRIHIWVTRRDTHLTTYFISFFDWALSMGVWFRHKFKGDRPRFGFWSHAFMNYDNNEIVEAVGKGVHRTFFDYVFDCDSAAALLPKNMTVQEWVDLQPAIEEELRKNLGKRYDTKFNLKDDDAVSCIELVRVVLKNKIKDYDLKFANFETMIKMYKNVTPQMLYESKDFVVIWEKIK